MSISHVQDALGSWSSGTSFTVTMTTGPVNGNSVFLLFNSRATGATITVSSVSSTNTTWTNDAQHAQGSSPTINSEIWRGVVSGGTGGTAITVNISATPTSSAATASEFSGVSTVSPLDGTPTTATGTTNPAKTSASYSAGSTGDLILGFANNKGSVTGNPGAPWTNIPGNSSIHAGYIANASSGTQTQASFTVASTINWLTYIVGYTAGAAPTNTDPPFTLNQPTYDSFPQIVCV